MHGWPQGVNDGDEEMKKYFQKRNELSVEQGILMWGFRVIIPKMFRKQLLEDIHGSHLGIVKMKSIARSYFWWPGLDKDIEDEANSCQYCLSERRNPPAHHLHVWEYPSKPFERVHADFAGPFMGKMYLIVTDAYSKWVEIFNVKSTSADQTIEKLATLFAQFGNPEQFYTDNGPPWTSGEFDKFMKSRGIRHNFSPPYHPASNGLAENQVKTFKHKLKTAVKAGVPEHLAIDRFLMDYRMSVHGTTNEYPAKLFLGRLLRTTLDCLRPSLKNTVLKQQQNQVLHHKGSRNVEFQVQDRVLVKNYRGKNGWVVGVITSKLSPVTYLVEVEPHVIWKRHVNQLLPCKTKDPIQSRNGQDDVEPRALGNPVDEVIRASPKTVVSKQAASSVESPNIGVSGGVWDSKKMVSPKCVVMEPLSNVNDSPLPIVTTPIKRYPIRERKQRNILDL